MSKVRIGRSIGGAYAFLFRHPLSIVGTAWLPAAFFAGLLAWWLAGVGADAHSLAFASGARLRVLAETLVFLAGSFLLISSIAVPLTRVAFGEERETVLAHFAIGPRELRLFLALLRFAALVLAALMIVAVAFSLIVQGGLVHLVASFLPGPKGFSADSGELWRGIPLRVVVADFGVLFAIAVAAAMALRLGFFLVPLAASGERARITRATALSRRSFGRLLLISIAIALPALVGFGALALAAVGASTPASLVHAFSSDADGGVLTILGAHAATVSTGAAAGLVVLIALFAGASVQAYRDRSTGADERDAVAAEPHLEDQRDSGTPFQDAEFAPAFAKVHPLATLLPPDAAPSASVDPVLAPAEESHAQLQDVFAPVDAMVDVVPELSAEPLVQAAAPAAEVPRETQTLAAPAEMPTSDHPLALPTEAATVARPEPAPAGAVAKAEARRATADA